MAVSVVRRLVAIVFPERCAACNKVVPVGEGFCASCRAELPSVGRPICPFCGAEKAWCDCQKRHRSYERVISPWYYDGVARKAVLHMKNTGDRVTVTVLAEAVADTVRQYYGDVTFDGVVCVPVTKRKQRERDGNPGEMLARAVANVLGLPNVHALVKLVDTAPQKTLPAEERSGNLLGVFDLAPGVSVMGKTFLLVDDVVTTGATLDECAKMLKIYGAEAVYAAAAAHTRKT